MLEITRLNNRCNLVLKKEREAMDAYMYILQCADGSYYTGSTKHLINRMLQHKSGNGSNHTRRRLPVTLVYLEYYTRIEDAFRREKQIQRWSAAKKEALIKRDIQKLKDLAACKNASHFLNNVNSLIE